MNRIFRKTACQILLPILLFTTLSSLSGDESEKTILLLHSYHKGYKWTDDITRGIIDTLGEDVTVQIEYMDTKRFLGPGGLEKEEYFSRYSHFLEFKYSRKKIDLLLISDNDALDFFRHRGIKLFPDTPAVFCGFNSLDSINMKQDQSMTGVNENADLMTSLNLIKQIFPTRNKLIFITDRTPTGEILAGEMAALTAKVRKDFSTVRILQNISMKDLEAALNRLDDTWAVFYTIFSQDSLGNYFEYDDSTRRVTEAAGEVPVFGTWDFSMDFGILGGHLVSGYAQGQSAAKKALEVFRLGGTEHVPILRESPHTDIFDYELLKKHGISHNTLPAGYILKNQPQSFYYTYRFQIISVTVIFVMLLIFIVILQNRNSQLHKTQALLKQERDTLDRRVEERTASLKNAQDELIRSERQAALGSLLAGMAHEINTPLGISITSSSHIRSRIETVQQHMESKELSYEELEEGLQILNEGIDLTITNLKRAAALVDNFKTISNSSHSRKPQLFRLDTYISEVVELYKHKFSEERIEIVMVAEPVEITSYKDMVYSVITQILNNSQDHAFIRESDEKKIIRITVKLESQRPVIQLWDNGTGIPEEIVKVLFEPFSTTKRNRGRVGLGLHKVYKTVTEKLNGSIQYREGNQGGTEFIIMLPAESSV